MSPAVLNFFSNIIDGTSTPSLVVLPEFSKGMLYTGSFILLLLFLFVYLVFSGILVYHWVVYGMRNKMIIFAGIKFTVVSVVLFIILFGLFASL